MAERPLQVGDLVYRRSDTRTRPGRVTRIGLTSGQGYIRKEQPAVRVVWTIGSSAGSRDIRSTIQERALILATDEERDRRIAVNAERKRLEHCPSCRVWLNQYRPDKAVCDRCGTALDPEFQAKWRGPDYVRRRRAYKPRDR